MPGGGSKPAFVPASGGLLAFTVERAPDGGAGFRLNPHGRYSHTLDYVRATLAKSGLSVVEIREDTLRQEAGEPVIGLVVTARRAAP